MTNAPRVIDDVATLKALADPARLELLELMMADHARSWTAKELALAIAVPAKKLYYHLGLLEKRGLLEIRDTHVVNGIIEKHYGAAQRSIAFRRGRDDDGGDEMARTITSLFDITHTSIQAGLRTGERVADRHAPDAERVVVSYSTAAMSPETAGRFRDSLLEVVERFDATAESGQPTFELLVAFNPKVARTPAP